MLCKYDPQLSCNLQTKIINSPICKKFVLGEKSPQFLSNIFHINTSS